MGRKLENAKGLYLEGIRDGRVREALDRYTGDRYVQHSTGVADGKDGFAAFFAPFLERNPKRDIRVVRAVEDGRYVFLHVYQNLNDGEAEWVTADLFDTDDDDRLVEHWDVIQEHGDTTTWGRTTVDGPTEVEDLEQTEVNKRIVRGFVDDVLLGARVDKATDYISNERFLQEVMTYGAATGATEYAKVHHLIGQGNFVVLYSHTRVAGEDHAFFDIFCLADGKIVEHWSVQEKILPKEQWNNSGKF